MKEKATNTLSRPLYDNCKMLSDEGEFMCFLSAKRAKWYIDRNLATIVQDSPLVFQLNFKPNGRGSISEYGCMPKNNQCVVCGSESELTKHHCVPEVYRDRFPILLKSRSSHDVVPVCRACHNAYETIADKKHRELLLPALNKQYFPAIKVWKDARVLLRYGDKIPSHVRQRLESCILEHHGHLDLELIYENKPSVKKVWDELVADFDPVQISKDWRQHFLDTMNPKFMPQGWTIDGVYCEDFYKQNARFI